MIVRGLPWWTEAAHHFSRWDGFEADNERQVQCAGLESATLRAHVNIAGLRASGWRGHDEVEGEGFASYPISLKVSRTAIVGTYLLRSLQPFGEHLRRISVHAIMREPDAQGRMGRPEGDDDDAAKEVRRRGLLSGVYEICHGGLFAGDSPHLSSGTIGSLLQARPQLHPTPGPAQAPRSFLAYS